MVFSTSMLTRRGTIGVLVAALATGCSFDLSLPDRPLVDLGGDRGDGARDAARADVALDVAFGDGPMDLPPRERRRDGAAKDGPADHPGERPRDAKPMPDAPQVDLAVPKKDGPPDQTPKPDLGPLVTCGQDKVCAAGRLVGGGIACPGTSFVLSSEPHSTQPRWDGTCSGGQTPTIHACCASPSLPLDVAVYGSDTGVKELTVGCYPSTHQVLGGSCDCGGTVAVKASYAPDDSHWTCECMAIPGTIQVWAYCMSNSQPDIVTANGNGAVACGQNTLVGGGCSHASAALTSLYPVGNGWGCASFGGTPTSVHVRCAQ